MTVYERDPDAAPDSAYRPGELADLVPGSRGRLLDPRRTPIRVVRVEPRFGSFTVRIDGYEDEGALWEVPFEDVGHYQFARDAPRSSEAEVARFRAAVEQFDRPLVIEPDAGARQETHHKLEIAREEASSWLRRCSGFLADGRPLPTERRRGDPLLAEDLERYMAERTLEAIERGFSRQFVSNPRSGELVKGHRIVLAELGLVAFEGKVLRHADVFDGDWSRARRAEHVVARMAFVQALLGAMSLDPVILFRGMSTDGPWRRLPRPTFVSATFSREVAESHFDAADDPASGVLFRQPVGARRVFMTYLETAAMNERFMEAEAVLLHDGDAGLF